MKHDNTLLAKEILAPASLGVSMSLLSFTVTLSTPSSYYGEFAEFSKFNALAFFINHWSFVSFLVCVVFSFSLFSLLLFSRYYNLVSSKLCSIVSVRLVAFACFDLMHDVLLVSTSSVDLVTTIFAPTVISLVIGYLLWVG
jgi:hypothetical protein